MASQDRKNLQVIQGHKNRITLKKSIIIICILLLVFFSGQRFIKIYQQKQVIDNLKMELENERIRNAQLEKEIEKLQSPEGIERIAREQLGLVKENEILIKPITVEEK
ncbi:MAG: septum formation initiator family protein [Clostridia bacterium]|jgi:cell division protein DivIC|nr:septum formation initiator family protein [Clostridia bacterium]